MKFLLPSRNALIYFGKGAKLVLYGNYVIGALQMKGSKMEARLLVQDGGLFTIGEEGFEQYADMYIRVMPKGELEINGLVANEGCQITAGKKIYIGKGCLFARDVVLRSDDVHTIKGVEYEASKPITIGSHVWIGQGASVMKGVTIGNGAIIASKALVLKNVPSQTLVGGVPSKIIRENVEWKA